MDRGAAPQAGDASRLLGCDEATVARADEAACRFNCEKPGAAATVVDSTALSQDSPGP